MNSQPFEVDNSFCCKDNGYMHSFPTIISNFYAQFLWRLGRDQCLKYTNNSRRGINLQTLTNPSSTDAMTKDKGRGVGGISNFGNEHHTIGKFHSFHFSFTVGKFKFSVK